MRVKELFLAAATAVSLFACGGAAEGDLESCATVYSGTFTGDEEGVITTLLQQDGTMFVYMRQADGTEYEDSQSVVDTDGNISDGPDGGQLEGVFDFDTCTAEGTWSEDGKTGTFELHDPTL